MGPWRKKTEKGKEGNNRLGKISFCGREENREGKGETYLGTENIVFQRRKNREEKERKYLEKEKNIWEEKEKEENKSRSKIFFLEEKEKEENIW